MQNHQYEAKIIKKLDLLNRHQEISGAAPSRYLYTLKHSISMFWEKIFDYEPRTIHLANPICCVLQQTFIGSCTCSEISPKGPSQ